MDSHIFRLNQMSYLAQQQHHSRLIQQHQRQQLLTSSQRINKGHYSNRQQQVGPAASLIKSQNQNVSSSTGSSGSENDDNLQLSSISTATDKTNSSQKAMLAHNGAKVSSQHHMMHQQQHHNKQRHQMVASNQHNRQAALQAHTLNPPTTSGKANFSKNNAINQPDNMTTSSSDHTIDDLHHLAHSYGHHRLTGSRFSGDGSAGGSSSSSQSGSRFLLGVLFTLAELLLFATVFLWLYWAYQHDDGLAWQNDRKQQFNTHAALMLFGFIFLSGQAMLIYRSFQCCSKIYTKILHTILFVLATSAISLGLLLGYTAQENVGANNKPIMHFYSLHAWIGITTVGLFVLQFVFGFVSFLILLCCDSATSKFRAALLPIHKTFGLIIFSLAIATCLTGLLQTARSRLSSKLNKVDYHELAEPGIVLNLIGVCLICLAILMPYIIRNLDIKRTFRSELDRHLKLSQLEMRI